MLLLLLLASELWQKLLFCPVSLWDCYSANLPCQSSPVHPPSISPWAWLWAKTRRPPPPALPLLHQQQQQKQPPPPVSFERWQCFQYKRIVNRDSLCNCSNISTDSLSSAIRGYLPTNTRREGFNLSSTPGLFSMEKLWISGPFINLFTNRSSRQQEKNGHAFLMCWKWWWIKGGILNRRWWIQFYYLLI